MKHSPILPAGLLKGWTLHWWRGCVVGCCCCSWWRQQGDVVWCWATMRLGSFSRISSSVVNFDLLATLQRDVGRCRSTPSISCQCHTLTPMTHAAETGAINRLFSGAGFRRRIFVSVMKISDAENTLKRIKMLFTARC